MDVKSKSLIFRAAAQAYINLAMTTRDISFLDRANDSIVWLERNDTPDLDLNLVSAYLSLGQHQKALEALRGVCIIADSQDRHDEWQKLADLIYSAYKKIPEGIRQDIGSNPSDEFGWTSISTVWLLSFDAQRLWNDGQQAEARNRLAKAEEISAKIYGNNVLVLLANTYTLMGETNKASRYLDRILEDAARLPPDAKAEAMSTISDAYAKNKQWRRARQVAEQTGNDPTKAVALSNILKVWKESN
jgi:tetratricopeptide (TPR) repeat protein